MLIKTIFSGFGGQGVLSMDQQELSKDFNSELMDARKVFQNVSGSHIIIQNVLGVK